MGKSALSKGMPKWQPRNMWKGSGLRLSIYLVLQIFILAYFLLIVVNTSDGQKMQQKPVQKFKQIHNPFPSSGVLSGQIIQAQASHISSVSISSGPCENGANCSERIIASMSNTDGNIVIQICYPSVFVVPLSTNKLRQQQRRFGRRFLLTQKKETAYCKNKKHKKTEQMEKEKAIWLGFELSDDSIEITMDGSMFIEKLNFYDYLPTNYNFDDLVKILFSQSDPGKIVPILADFLDNIGNGAFLNDFPLVALFLDFSASMDFWQKSGNNFSIIWEVKEETKKELPKEERQKRLKECKKEVKELNERAGIMMYQMDENWCLKTQRERNQLYGELPDPNPLGLNQTFGGQAKKPLVPAPPEDPKIQRGRMSYNGTIPAEYAFGISYIRTQIGDTCWATAAASVLTDRACIAALKAKNASGKLDQFHLGQDYLKRVASARDASECTYDSSNGLAGGNAHKAWEYYTKKGTVNELCKPNINPKSGWEHHCFRNCDSKVEDNGSLDLLHWRDKMKTGGTSSHDSNNYVNEVGPEDWVSTKGFAGMLYRATESRKLYRIDESGWHQTIINEFEENGPVCASMQTYEDFGGNNGIAIYRHDKRYTNPGSHAVRIIGYGEHDCTRIGGGIDKYWLVANSWGTRGMNKGTFKIARGENECLIEDNVSFGQIKWVFGHK